MATSPTNRSEWEGFLKAHPFQQFGQQDDESTYNGSTGCTHTQLQKLVLAKTGHLYSQDEISSVAGYPWPRNNGSRRGMRFSDSSTNELMKVVRHFNLPYEPYFFNGAMTSGVWNFIKYRMQMGPVLNAVRYSHYPEHKGYHYGGVIANGRPNGYAQLNGKTQLTGAESIAHMVMYAAYWDAGSAGWLVDSFDPNHGSPSRQEKPGYDRISTKQTQVLINTIRLIKLETATGIKSRSLAFLVPTRYFPPR